jgi:benzil reductase ((S)-benzoin forming)
MHLTVLTGASRGLGLAMAEQLLAQGHQVLAISRQPTLTSSPVPTKHLLQWQADLADAAPTAARLQAWLAAMPAPPSSATLINNAGVLSTLAPLADNASAELANAMRVGLEAPLLLTAAFLHATAAWQVPRKVLLISSGLGRRAMAGSASYCAAKAGMDHLARAVALEQAQVANGAHIVSLAPGVIDTDMQVQLRNADSRFAERERFASMKATGQLDSPGQAAAKVLAYLARADFGAQPVGDVRDPA